MTILQITLNIELDSFIEDTPILDAQIDLEREVVAAIKETIIDIGFGAKSKLIEDSDMSLEIEIG